MRTDVLVVGGGKSGLAAARAAANAGARTLLLDPRAGSAPDGVDLATGRGHSLLFAPDGTVGGVLAVAGREAFAVEARAVVLACGGVSGLWDARFADATGDAFAMAHRAGARLRDLGDLRAEEDGRVWTAGGIVADRHGRTTLAHLFACGAATGGGVGGIAAGAWAAEHLAAEGRGVELEATPDVDTPLPEGFADAKMARLRETMRTLLPASGARDAELAFRRLHALKGEADDFARARTDAELWQWKNACEAALLVAADLRSPREAERPRA